MSAGPYLLLDSVRAATADEYIIEGELGRGGMAAVFLGRDIALDRRVAIKVMLPNLVGVAGSQDRFVVEARTAAQLDHPGIVTVYAVKQRAGLTFIVMKYIEGRTLDQVLATRGALDASVVATIGSHVAEALHFAHSQGVVHRDVKPSNIIIDVNGRPVVTDFGIAKVSSAPSLTLAGSALGTPGYMSPEQCLGLPVTAASDQYSLGIMLYELLTGGAPFSGTLFELMKAHTSAVPAPIRDVRPDIDPALDAIITIMLAKNAAERFPSLRDVSKALASLAPRRSQAAERQAIMAAIAAVPPSTELAEAINATTEEVRPGATAPAAAPDMLPVSAQDNAVTEPAAAPPTRRRPVTHVVALVVAIALLASVGYAIATRTLGTSTVAEQAPTAKASVDSVGPTAATSAVSAATPDTTPIVRADTASNKVDTTSKSPVAAPPSAAPPAVAPATKTTAPKTAAKRDSPKATRPDSIAARCAAINLKLSLGEDVPRADSTFLRRECTRTRP